jgi:hypothetical protein
MHMVVIFFIFMFSSHSFIFNSVIVFLSYNFSFLPPHYIVPKCSFLYEYIGSFVLSTDFIINFTCHGIDG